MARIRTIKPEFPQSGSTGRVSRDARLLFIQIWTLCDDVGILRGDSRMLASLLYPYDDGEEGRIRTSRADVEGWLVELEREGCVLRYKAEGDDYLKVCNWLKHQKIDKPSASKHPPPPETPRESSRKVAKPRHRKGREGTKEGTKDQGPSAFEKFWSAYPRREAKQDAIAAFNKLNPDASLLEKIVAAVVARSGTPDWKKDGGKFIPLPATYLNGGRWEDEPLNGAHAQASFLRGAL